MKNRLTAFLVSLLLAGLLGNGAHAQQKSAGKNLELFGVTVKNAPRQQLRDAFKQNGLVSNREDDRYWVDIYDASAALDGAKELKAGYVAASGQFAFAEYSLPSFMDTAQVGKVINMVAAKYGRPSSQSGSYGLGEVTAKWNMGQSMQIVVERGWPNTSTYLRFVDTGAHAQMQAEINAQKQKDTQEKARSQSRAF